MSRKKFTNITNLDGLQVIPDRFPVASGTVESIKEGMMAAFASNAAAEAADGATAYNGIAASPSSETASAAGEVELYRSKVMRFFGFAEVPGNLTGSTLLTKVTLTVSGEEHLINENNTTNGFIRIISQNVNGVTGLCLLEAEMTV